MAEFRMPSLGADMESGTLVAWHVKPGDLVHRGDVIAEVETQKGVIEVDVYESGTVEQLLVPTGTRVPVGTPLAQISTAAPIPAAAPALPISAAGTAPPRPAAPPTPPAPSVAPPPKVPAAPPRPAAAARPRVSPLARRLAAAHGFDLATLRGTGVGGVITRADVLQAVEAGPRPPAVAPPEARAPIMPPAAPVALPAAGERLAAMRQAIGAAMSKAHREIPHYYLSTEIDLSVASNWLTRENLKRAISDRVLLVALLLKSVALATRSVPEVNGFWIDGSFHPSAAVHLGVAISLRGGGLIAPAIHDVDHLSIDQLMIALGDLVARARTGGLRSSEVADPTITVTNLGDQGVTEVFGIIYPPQVALVGFGKVTERAWGKDGMVGVRPIVTATLSADHRVSDGHRGGRFLAAIDRLLQTPEQL
jgi:pyruvate dehydrogenase E2 component (dihydrolipoamide acetyltransferase)